MWIVVGRALMQLSVRISVWDQQKGRQKAVPLDVIVLCGHWVDIVTLHRLPRLVILILLLQLMLVDPSLVFSTFFVREG